MNMENFTEIIKLTILNEEDYNFSVNINENVENYTDDPDFYDGNKFILPWWRQLIWTILFLTMVIVAIGGNFIVIWIILAHKQMRTITNYFLLNLSVADIMISILNVIFNYIYMLNSHWPFGTLYCKISQFTAVLSICASIFTLMAISIDRYRAIMYPLKPRMGRYTTLCIIIFIWIASSLLSSPALLYSTTYTIEFTSETRIICYAEWPDGSTYLSNQEYVYNVALLIITYILPIIAMSYTYTRVGVELWGSQSIGERTQRQMDSIKSKRRIVKMMITVVLIFSICWLPFHLFFIITSHCPEITDSPYIQETYLAIYWLAMSNSMYNPIIYYWMNTKFRYGFLKFVAWCPCIHIRPELLTHTEVISKNTISGSLSNYQSTRNNK